MDNLSQGRRMIFSFWIFTFFSAVFALHFAYTSKSERSPTFFGVSIGIAAMALFAIAVLMPPITRALKFGYAMHTVIGKMFVGLEANKDAETERFVFEHIVSIMRHDPKLYEGFNVGISDPVLARLCAYCREVANREKSHFSASGLTLPCHYLNMGLKQKQLIDLEKVLVLGRGDLKMSAKGGHDSEGFRAST